MQTRTVLSKHFARVLNAQVFSWKWSASALAIALASASYAPSVMAQETAGQINGSVFDAQGAPAGGIPVTIRHVPSGTVTNVTSNEQGRFIARGLRLGGPYEVTYTPPGGGARKVEQAIFVSLGEAFELDIALAGRQGIEEIVVVGAQTLSELKTGPSTTFNLNQIEGAPTISRDLKDIIRADPKVYIDRFNEGAIQIGGTNNRFNLLTVDGIRQNDDFGLNGGGYPTLRSPLSLDVIEQLSVNTAPFPVTYSGFQGGNINIVTKSGSNDFTGSAFFAYTDDSLTGDKSGNRAIAPGKFKDKTYGGTFGGPIVKDRLFFFVGYEKYETGTQVERGPAGSPFPVQVGSVSQADYDNVRNIARTVYNYDILGLDAADLPVTDEKIFAKINWNILDEHRLSVTYNRNKGSQIIQPGPAAFTPAGTVGPVALLGARSNWYNQTQELDSVSVQLFSDWSDVFKTEIKYGWKSQANAPIPLGNIPWAEVQIRTPGGGNLVIGPDRFRHFNVLDTETQNIKLKADYLLGNHTITAGYEREMVDVFNAFMQDNYGVYFFNSIADFQARRATALTFQNAVSGNRDDGAGEFKSNIDSFYLQDSWDVTSDLTVIGGVRYERYSSPDQPALNTRFQGRYGFPNTETYDGRDLVLPRLAFNYKFSDSTVFRGGVGIFGGGNPNVWLSNSFSNAGVVVSNTTITRTSAPALAATLDNVNPGVIPAAVQGALVAGDGSVNAIDPKFKIPSVWKASLGFDQTFDLGWFGQDYFFSAEVIYSKSRNPVLWLENRVVPTGATAPDGRPLYARRAGVPTGGNDLVMTNASGGESWVVSVLGQKTFETGVGDFDLQLGYAWTDSKDVNSGTSSTAQSNWDNLATSNINNPSEATSNYETKHNITMGAQWSKAFIGEYKTMLSLFGTTRSGRGYSYTFAGNSSIFGDPRQAARQRQLFYVPRDQNDVIIRGGGLTWDALNAYIVSQGLDKYRGQIVPRNAFKSPWSTQFDLRIAQEIPAFFPEGAKGVFSMDIRNVGNLINNKWGRNSQFDFPFVVPVVEAVGIENGRYVYSGPIRPLADRKVIQRQSVWAIQFTVRYSF
jgi:outer membrane receptor for ferrienterochelin and colicin